VDHIDRDLVLVVGKGAKFLVLTSGDLVGVVFTELAFVPGGMVQLLNFIM